VADEAQSLILFWTIITTFPIIGISLIIGFRIRKKLEEKINSTKTNRNN
jgi:hypothetical protein